MADRSLYVVAISLLLVFGFPDRDLVVGLDNGLALTPPSKFYLLNSRFGHEPSLLPREYQKPGYVSVWDPHTQKHCHDIEGIQRSSAWFWKKKTVLEGTRHCHQPAKQFELPSIKTETQNLVTYKIVYKIVNSKIAVDIQDYISRPTRISRSYHGRCFNDISSNSNTYKYNFYALPSTQVAGYSAVKPNLLWSLLNLL